MNLTSLQKNVLLEYFQQDVYTYGQITPPSSFFFHPKTADLWFCFGDHRKLLSEDAWFLLDYEKRAAKSIKKCVKDCITAEMFDLFVHWATGLHHRRHFLTLRFTDRFMTYDGVTSVVYDKLVAISGKRYFFQFVRLVVRILQDFFPNDNPVGGKVVFYEDFINNSKYIV